jgi:hypothetical protein
MDGACGTYGEKSRRWDANITDVVWKGVDRVHLSECRRKWLVVKKLVKNLSSS